MAARAYPSHSSAVKRAQKGNRAVAGGESAAVVKGQRDMRSMRSEEVRFEFGRAVERRAEMGGRKVERWVWRGCGESGGEKAGHWSLWLRVLFWVGDSGMGRMG